MFAVAVVIVLVLLLLAIRAPAPPSAPLGVKVGRAQRREPAEGMWLEVRDVLTSEAAAVSTPDFVMPTPAAGLPEPLDRRKPRRMEPPERIDK